MLDALKTNILIYKKTYYILLKLILNVKWKYLFPRKSTNYDKPLNTLLISKKR